MNVHDIVLDVDKRGVAQAPIVIAQGDRNATTIRAAIRDGGAAVADPRLSARFRMRLPDDAHFYEKAAEWDAERGVATVTIDEAQAASATGTTSDAYFELLAGPEVVHSTSRFAIRVIRGATSGMDPATSYSDRIEELIEEIGTLDDLPLPSRDPPQMDGPATAGTSARYAREDHVHPTDTTRAAKADVVAMTNEEIEAIVRWL